MVAASSSREWLRVSGEKTLGRWNPRGGKSGDAGRACGSVAWEPQRKGLGRVENPRTELWRFLCFRACDLGMESKSNLDMDSLRHL